MLSTEQWERLCERETNKKKAPHNHHRPSDPMTVTSYINVIFEIDEMHSFSPSLHCVPVTVYGKALQLKPISQSHRDMLYNVITCIKDPSSAILLVSNWLSSIALYVYMLSLCTSRALIGNIFVLLTAFVSFEFVRHCSRHPSQQFPCVEWFAFDIILECSLIAVFNACSHIKLC